MKQGTILAILLAGLTLLSVLAPLVLAQQAQSATILQYDDGTAQLVLVYSEDPHMNITGHLAIVVSNTSIVVNYTITMTIGRLTGLIPMNAETRTDIRGTGDGYEGKFEASISDNTSSLKLRIDPIRYDAAAREVYMHLYFEATGDYSSIIDLLHEQFQAAANMSNETVRITINAYEPGRSLEVEVTARGEGPDMERIGSFDVEILRVLAEVEDEGLRVDSVLAYARISNGTMYSWGYIKLTGNVTSIIDDQPADRAVDEINSVIAQLLPAELTVGLVPTSDLPSQLRQARLALPTYYGFEAGNGQVKIVLPRVAAENGDTVQLLEQTARDLGAESVETKQASPDQPEIPMSDYARSELTGGSGLGPGMTLALIVVAVILAAAVLVLKARS